MLRFCSVLNALLTAWHCWRLVMVHLTCSRHSLPFRTWRTTMLDWYWVHYLVSNHLHCCCWTAVLLLEFLCILF